mmetsp:Transcript_19911/g.46331  ORF Transcript_19911/g.46331 Transcript_19911/m.46331 type:complete len:308 (+) Transcript_19911:18-941(+)
MAQDRDLELEKSSESTQDDLQQDESLEPESEAENNMVPVGSRPRPQGNLDMHEIVPRLWLGSLRAASDVEALQRHGISHVLTIGLEEVREALGPLQRARFEPTTADPFVRFVVSVDDKPSARLDRHFEACSAFIIDGLSNQQAVLVHCSAGQSRSPTVVIAHLMLEAKWSFQLALKHVQDARPGVCPNIGFMDQLRSFEKRLLADPSSGFNEHGGTRQLQQEAAEADASRSLHTSGMHVEATQESRTPTASEGFDADAATDPFDTAETQRRCAKLRARCRRLQVKALLMAHNGGSAYKTGSPPDGSW